MKRRIAHRSAPMNPADLRMDRSERPGWQTGSEQVPAVGQQVHCTAGLAEVVHVMGKTGNGSRLLELRLLGKDAPPFLAAASNVLVQPGAGDDPLTLLPPAGPDWLR